jgi:hypothetical protein
MADLGLTKLATVRTLDVGTMERCIEYYIIFSAPLYGAYIQMAFCPGTPNEKS